MEDSFEILFIDDEPLIVELAGKAITELGYNVKLFNDSIDALEYFKINHQKIRIIFSDLSMPRMNGLELCEKCNEIQSTTCVLASGNHNELTSLSNKNYKLLYKPYKKTDISELISGIMKES